LTALSARKHLPDIFEKTLIRDTVKLQVMLFAVQCSCAKSWIQCGVQAVTVVGHTFGELTALCVSGTLSIEDTIKMIAGRAGIIRDNGVLRRVL
jgi:acyl transferase domain-containing protein